MAISMEGRTVVVFGVANKRSIAWAIAQRMQTGGRNLAITYQNERLKQEADDMISALPNAAGFQCDVSSDDEIAKLFAIADEIRQARRSRPQHRLCSRRGAAERVLSRPTARPSASRSIPARTRWSRSPARAAPLMTDGGSIVTMTYYGAEKVVPSYNVMGVAKAALEAASATSRPISASTRFASTPFPPDRSRLWRRAASGLGEMMRDPGRKVSAANAISM